MFFDTYLNRIFLHRTILFNVKNLGYYIRQSFAYQRIILQCTIVQNNFIVSINLRQNCFVTILLHRKIVSYQTILLYQAVLSDKTIQKYKIFLQYNHEVSKNQVVYQAFTIVLSTDIFQNSTALQYQNCVYTQKTFMLFIIPSYLVQ